jgi:SAM-dependent methyltransferase
MTDRNAPTGDHVCPWWFASTFDNVLRRLVHDPPGILAPFLSEGMTVLDAGCGMGHFSIGMARLVGERGKIVGGHLLYSEPSFHVGAKTFRDICRRALEQGFSENGQPRIRFSRTSLLGKS